MKERYHVTGMSCSACSSHVEKAVNKLENVEKASVNLLTETMDVTYDETKITSAEIIDAVVKAGYGASVMTEGSVAGAGGQSTSSQLVKQSHQPGYHTAVASGEMSGVESN